MAPPPTRRETLRSAVLFGGTAAVLLWPLALHPTSRLPAGGDASGDAFQFLWNLWWTRTALVDLHQTPFHTDLLFWPVGTPLVYHTLSLGNAALAVPLQVLWPGTDGLVFALTALTLLSFALTGFGGWLLCRQLGAAEPWALLGGALAAWTPYRLWHLHHLNLLSLHWAVLSLAFLVQALRADRPRRFLLWAGLFAAWTGWSDYETLIHLAVAALLSGLVYAGRAGFRRLLSVGGTYAAVTGVGLLPLLAAVVAVPPHTVARPGVDQVHTFSANLLGLACPPRSGLPGLAWPRAWEVAGPGLTVDEVALGPVLLITVAGLAVFVRRVRPLAAMAGILVLLALGPRLNVGPWTLGGDWLPYAWFSQLPAMNMSRCPVRFLGMAWIALAAVVACGLTVLGRRGGKSRVLAAVVGIALVVEHLPVRPVPTVPVPVPDAVRFLADHPEPGAVLALPDEARHALLYMFWQTIHRRPLATGYTARPHRSARAWLQRLDAADPEEQLSLLRAARIRWIARHPDPVEALLHGAEPTLHAVPQ